MNEDVADMVSKALRKAFQLGQTYWEQAELLVKATNKMQKLTQGQFDDLVEETRNKIISVEV